MLSVQLPLQQSFGIFLGKTNKEFNLRHDWNSLISHDETLRMTRYSKEFFPQADVLVCFALYNTFLIVSRGRDSINRFLFISFFVFK